MNIKRRITTLLLSATLILSVWVHPFNFDDPALDQFLDSEIPYEFKRTGLNPSDIINILRIAGAINLLEEDFFLHTNFLNTRNVIDAPLFIPPWCLPCERLFGLYLFFNQYNDKNFTLRRNTINAYISVGENSFVSKLQNVLERTEDLLRQLGIDIDPEALIDILSMFEQFTVQERKLGFMFAGHHTFENCTHFRLLVPLYWFERNYFIDCQIQKLLQEVLDPLTGTPSPEEQQAFQREHLISDALGVGDTRIELDWLVTDSPDTTTHAGILITLPTSFALKRGLYGTHFKKNRPRPLLDFVQLSDTDISQEKTFETFSCFALSALDNLSAMLLSPDLGNSGHFGVGPLIYLRSSLSKYIQRPWTECFAIKGRYSLEFQFPAKERLFYIENDAALFARRDFTDDTQAADNLVFLEETLTNRLFPFSFLTTVGPTLIFRSTTQGIYEGNYWGGFMGFDTYARTKKLIYSVDAPNIQLSKLCIGKAASPWIWQSKVLGGISYRSQHDDKLIIFAVTGDKTFLTKGLGRDFSLSFNIDINF